MDWHATKTQRALPLLAPLPLPLAPQALWDPSPPPQGSRAFLLLYPHPPQTTLGTGHKPILQKGGPRTADADALM